ncbi:MAG: UDP-3-O-acyl-N-acetylglucosamine deacetylase [Planctomycetota bacterium]|nr:UDP-3-O-acyl-N-acetylglucosamine deacetylase [Planctomycetota bacterium]
MTMRALQGVGLFTGVDARVECSAGEGLTLCRGGAVEHVSVGLVQATPVLENVPPGFPVRNTTIGMSDGRPLATVEQVLSCAAGLGVWGVRLTVEGPEIPIDDGSAAAFVRLMEGFARVESEPIVPREVIEVDDGRGASIIVKPRRERGCSFTYVLDYGAGSPIAPQRATWEGDPREYATEIAPARTFSLLHEVQMAQKFGLFKRFTPRDLLVVGPDGAPIENAWRFANEPARHKLLDLIGDLALLGVPLQADVVATRSGHAMTHEVCRRVVGGKKFRSS